MKKNNKGQIVVEYVLLLVVATGVAAFLISQLVSRNPDEPGILVAKWHGILKVVADDKPDARKK
ncbi:hypothetical protein ACES2L_11100 [Bdellovibrio bacteriovorus]|uniref:Uncharacterized protein n=1 Tax=Bdellovibrio reynosensis TaxID=2835041 RepID=A0ABY4CCK5_9BACT|nr:hypothetical protein [Bdellovibrio reynosensis]UOF01451.1 hypothetical protein MNR06_00600 [Bdellovibrio reynosensis]